MSEEITEAPVVVQRDDDDETVFGWLYLAFLFIVFLALALSAYSCNRETDPVVVETSEVSDSTTPQAVELSPVALTATIVDGQVTLTGEVPDEAAANQAVGLAEARYGAGNVVNQLTIDDGTTLAGGTLRVVGEAFNDDARPEDLHADLAGAFGLSSDGAEITYKEITLTPFAATAVVATDQVTLAGEMPDQDSLDALVAASEETWGIENVDSSGLTIGSDLTRDGSTVTVIGLVDAGDVRPGAYGTAIEAAIGGATVDVAGVEIDTSSDALGRAEAKLREAVALEPILFASGSAEIDPSSDATLERAAAAINAAPGISIEVVGHTDSQGSDGVNQLISADRAEAVMNRLIELGVDAGRLTSRGAGEDEPVADNDTDEGRAANRRIAFEFEGAGESGADEASTDEESTDEG